MSLLDGLDEDLSFGRRPVRPTGTMTICARCEESGEFGVATLSGTLAAGAFLGLVRHQTAAVASQGTANPYLKFWVIGSLLSRNSADLALKEALDRDKKAPDRQVLIVAEGGASAAHTGRRVASWGGHMIGDNYAIGAHGLNVETAVEAMADSFIATGGQGLELSERMLRALETGLEANTNEGKERAAALQVSGPDGMARFDLRIDDAKDPLARLRLLYTDYLADDMKVDRFMATSDRPAGRIPTQLDEALIYLRRHWLHGLKTIRNRKKEKSMK